MHVEAHQTLAVCSLPHGHLSFLGALFVRVEGKSGRDNRYLAILSSYERSQSARPKSPLWAGRTLFSFAANQRFNEIPYGPRAQSETPNLVPALLGACA